MAQTTVPLLPFEGTMNISSLAAFPLDYHPRKEAVSKFLIERGRRFEELKGCHYMEYTGVGLGEKIMCGRAQYSVCVLHFRLLLERIADITTDQRQSDVRQGNIQPHQP